MSFAAGNQKLPPIRDAAYLRLIRKLPCLILSPWCQGRGEVQACHSNAHRHGKGLSRKAEDIFSVPGCPDCHRWLDQGPATKEEKEHTHAMALEAAWEALWRFGAIGVKDEDVL